MHFFGEGCDFVAALRVDLKDIVAGSQIVVDFAFTGGFCLIIGLKSRIL